MGFKTYTAKSGAEGFTLTAQIGADAPTQITGWPHEARSRAEEALLEEHPLVEQYRGDARSEPEGDTTTAELEEEGGNE